jgi:Holliday junction resolvase RusA-like endonuclease
VTEWRFEVAGIPRPKGSWKTVPKGGAQPIRRGKDLYWRIRDTFLKPQNHEGLNAWVEALQWGAKAGDPRPPKQAIPGPWFCSITFWFTPPDSRIGETYAIGKKKEADGTTTDVGDEDKLRRAVLDALEGIYWTNDRHVCDGGTTKLYRRKPGALVVVRFLEEEQLCL